VLLKMTSVKQQQLLAQGGTISEVATADPTKNLDTSLISSIKVPKSDPPQSSTLPFSFLTGLPLPSFLIPHKFAGAKRFATDAVDDVVPPSKKRISFCWWGGNKSCSDSLMESSHQSRHSITSFACDDDVVTLEEESQQQQESSSAGTDSTAPLPPSSESAGASDARLLSLPEDLLYQCFSFIDPAEDRASISLACKKLRQIMNEKRMLRLTDLFGCPLTGKRCIILENDSKEAAIARMQPYFAAGSADAFYLVGMIKCYCDEDVQEGVKLLRQGLEYEHLECMYSLGIILRDMDRQESKRILLRAHELGCLPATLEVLPAALVRKLHGDVPAEELRLHLGPIPLGKLLRRYFVDESKTRINSSSHCWNPVCGRWGYKNAHASHNEDYDINTITQVRSISDSSVTTASHCAAAAPASSNMKCARMKVCSSCRRAKYCSKLCQVYDWRSERHKAECQFLR
jgi:hypothetical protein